MSNLDRLRTILIFAVLIVGALFHVSPLLSLLAIGLLWVTVLSPSGRFTFWDKEEFIKVSIAKKESARISFETLKFSITNEEGERKFDCSNAKVAKVQHLGSSYNWVMPKKNSITQILARSDEGQWFVLQMNLSFIGKKKDRVLIETTVKRLLVVSEGTAKKVLSEEPEIYTIFFNN